MKIDLKYGSDILGYEVPDVSQLLKTKNPDFTIDEGKFKASLLKILHENVNDFTKTAIVIADKTRLCGYENYLPWLIDTLKEAGAKKENIIFYISYGTHPKQSDEESLKSYGETFKNYTFVHHDCTDESAFVNKGKTSRGTDIMVRRDILESTCLITFGAISHHYFAGYGGGRKLIFPGLGYKFSVYQNHSLFLNFNKNILNEGCSAGNLEGNPLAEDLLEVDKFSPKRISIHGILDKNGKVSQLHIGNNYNDFLAACKLHDSNFKSESQEKFDMVIASAGGYPKDINFIQGHKSVHNAAAFVKDGGKLIIFAECRDGIGNNGFLPLFSMGGQKEVFSKLKSKYEGNGGTALAMMAKTKRITIYMITSLDEKTCELIEVVKTNSNNVQALIEKHVGTIAVIPNASMLVK